MDYHALRFNLETRTARINTTACSETEYPNFINISMYSGVSMLEIQKSENHTFDYYRPRIKNVSHEWGFLVSDNELEKWKSHMLDPDMEFEAFLEAGHLCVNALHVKIRGEWIKHTLDEGSKLDQYE